MATPNAMTIPIVVGHGAQRRRYPVTSPPMPNAAN